MIKQLHQPVEQRDILAT